VRLEEIAAAFEAVVQFLVDALEVSAFLVRIMDHR
jgi:hypothetical protein